jgi:hypothetical protein
LFSISEKSQSLLRNLLKRAGYATLQMRPRPGENRSSETELIERIRSGMISPEEYPSSATSAATQSGVAEDKLSAGIRDRSAEDHGLLENQTFHTATEFAVSSNGDRWFWCQQATGDQSFILHQANAASGGHETRATITAFLDIRPRRFEHDALATLLAER